MQTANEAKAVWWRRKIVLVAVWPDDEVIQPTSCTARHQSGPHQVNMWSTSTVQTVGRILTKRRMLLQVRPAPYLTDGGVLKRQQRTILETSPGGPDSGLWTTSWPHFKQRWTLQCGLHLMPTSGLNSGLKRFSRICIFHQVKRAGLLTTRSNQLQTVGQVLGTSQQRRRNTRTRTKKKKYQMSG